VRDYINTLSALQKKLEKWTKAGMLRAISFMQSLLASNSNFNILSAEA